MLSGCAGNEPSVRTPTQASTPSPAATLSSPTSSAQSTQRPPAKPKQTSVTVVMNGDLLWHNTLWFGAREDARRRGHGGYDFAPLLAGMKPVIASADMAICHEEVRLLRQADRTETIRCSPRRQTSSKRSSRLATTCVRRPPTTRSTRALRV
jgi:hypothetical protein